MGMGGVQNKPWWQINRSIFFSMAKRKGTRPASTLDPTLVISPLFSSCNPFFAPGKSGMVDRHTRWSQKLITSCRLIMGTRLGGEVDRARKKFLLHSIHAIYIFFLFVAGWSSLVARQAHNLKVAGSNPAPAPNLISVLFYAVPFFYAFSLNA